MDRAVIGLEREDGIDAMYRMNGADAIDAMPRVKG
jgi:hypothetical protein